MSGPGDIGGEVSGEEAAWRDLIARFDVQADAADPTAVPWPTREDLTDPAAAADLGAEPKDAEPRDQSAGLDPPEAKDRPGSRVTTFYLPSDRARVIRPAGDPRSYSPPEEADERYVPAPLPPPAKLDTASKAALAGVIGGPGYLLVVSIFLHWTISAEAAFIAVAAFIAGFVTLVVKLGDRPRHDDDDNNDGAVV
jgi:hypothetical protein